MSCPECKELRRQLTIQREANHARNIEMDALHFVWCDGGCEGGVHRWTKKELTMEIVEAAEKNTRRLRDWYENHAADQRRAKEKG